MNAQDWIQKALEELVELVEIADRDEEDAWRVVVLIARLRNAPTPLPVPDEFENQLPGLLAAAGPPDPQEVLDRLADELDADEDPAGPLLDVLLDVDDAVGVFGLLGSENDANTLAERAAGLAELYPERVLDLDEFAEMRLRSLRSDAPSSAIWRAVERAPAHALAEALPPPEERRAQTPATVHPLASWIVPTELYQEAAAAPESEASWRLVAQGRPEGAWIYELEGRMRLEIRGGERPPSRVTLVATRTADDAESCRIDVELEIDGRTAYGDLGPWAGRENALQQLVSRTGLRADQVLVRLLDTDD